MTKFCTNCGAALIGEEKNCSNCGANAFESRESVQMGVGKFLKGYIRQSLTVLKNPKQMIPTIVLGLIWLVLALLGSFGINPLPVRILSFLTFAQGGMFGGVFGAVGGILGKVVVAAFLNAAIVPLFQKKAPFKKGFPARSAPIVVSGPCPANTRVSSGRTITTSFNVRRSTVELPPGRSVRPTEPAKSTSPVTTVLYAAA